MKTNETVALTLRVLMGAWFLYTGAQKVFVTGLDGFITDINNYKLVGPQVSIAVAYLIPWAEIIAGFCFMAGLLRKGAWLTMLTLVLAFTVSVGSAWWRGLDISCGCLGSAEKISYWKKAAEFALYYAVLAYIAWVEWRRHSASLASGER